MGDSSSLPPPPKFTNQAGDTLDGPSVARFVERVTPIPPRRTSTTRAALPLLMTKRLKNLSPSPRSLSTPALQNELETTYDSYRGSDNRRRNVVISPVPLPHRSRRTTKGD